jgi:acyl-CoA reductase-like NAD-dependent aldehyde dehydrogenase
VSTSTTGAVPGTDTGAPDSTQDRIPFNDSGSALVAAGPDAVSDAVTAAVAARAGWRRTPPGARAAALRAAAAAVRADTDRLGDLLCRATGRLLGQAR